MSDDDNPYKMPDAAITAPSDLPKSQPVKAIMAGFAVLLTGRAITFSYTELWLLFGQDYLDRSAFLQSYATIIGISKIVLGFIAGYACARIARHGEIRCAGLLCCLVAGYSILTSLSTIGEYFISLLGMLLFSSLFIFLGALLGRRKNRKLEKQRDATAPIAST